MTNEEMEIASIVWTSCRSGQGGAPEVEVLYELHCEEDLLRRAVVNPNAIYEGARRGDTIFLTGEGADVEVHRVVDKRPE